MKIQISRYIKLALLIVSGLFIFGCAVVPTEIRVAQTEPLTDFETVSINKTEIIGAGTKARWGGKIVKVENKKDVSEIEIVFFPENNYGKPRISQPSIGRFKAVVKGFVDPVVFEEGRLITVVGEVSDLQTGLIGEQQYSYPTLTAMGYHMWKDTQDVDVEAYSFSPFGFHAGFNRSFFSPWHDPFWNRRNQRVRMRVIRNGGHDQGAVVNSGASTNNSSTQNKPNRTSNTKAENKTYQGQPSNTLNKER